MSKKEKILSLAAVLAIAIVYVGMALAMDRLYGKLFPLIFSSIVAILCIVGIILEARKPAAPAKETKGEGKAKETWSGYAKVLVWALAFFVAVWFFGFVYTIPVFVFAYLKTHKTKWLPSIITGAVTGLVIWFVFIQILHVYLHEGYFFG